MRLRVRPRFNLPTVMRPRSVFALLLAALVFLPACDTAEEDVLTAAFFVGTWDLDQVRDGTGDRTNEAFNVLDGFTIEFESGGAFTLDVDLEESINQEGTPDTTIPGVYSVTEAGQLVLNVGAVAPSFTVERQNENRAALMTPAVIINQVLAAANVDLELTGTVTLIIGRR